MPAQLSKPKREHAHWSDQEAFLGVMTLMAVWEAHGATSRLRAVHAFAERSPFLSALGEKGLVQLHDDVVKRMGEAECDALEQACAQLPSDMGASVYAACVDVLGAPGTLSDVDRGMLERLRALLSVDAALARQIETVLLLKNRY